MEKLKKYQSKIFNAITIFLILEFVIFPGLSTANTLFNILAGIALLLLVLWGGLALYDYARSSKELPKEEELKDPETELDYAPKPKKTRAKKSEFPMPPHNTKTKK
jgi:hypothetical protein